MINVTNLLSKKGPKGKREWVAISYQLQTKERVAEAPGLESEAMPTIPVDERKNRLTWLELGYALQQAIEEASHCVRTYRVGVVGLEKSV